MVASPFGPPKRWRRDDLIAVSEEFDESMVLTAYRQGVFPMPLSRGLMGWYSPLVRGVLPLDGLRVSRSLRKMQARYEIRVDTAFDAVLEGCADRRRPHGWIDADIRRVYRRLHARRIVHSVESWTPDGQLAGGLYGVSLGGLFAGESMFHRPDIGRDASKVALIALVELLRASGSANGDSDITEPADHRILDVQWSTPHLASLGVVEVERRDYLDRLPAALEQPAPDWPTPST